MERVRRKKKGRGERSGRKKGARIQNKLENGGGRKESLDWGKERRGTEYAGEREAGRKKGGESRKNKRVKRRKGGGAGEKKEEGG